MSALKLYDVTVDGYGSAIITATSPGKARASAWRCDALSHISFGEFMRMSRVRLRTEPPVDDGHGYVRDRYGVDPKIGQRVGLSEGRAGTVAYPGKFTAHVHVLVDGREHVTTFHPSDISLSPERTDP